MFQSSLGAGSPTQYQLTQANQAKANQASQASLAIQRHSCSILILLAILQPGVRL